MGRLFEALALYPNREDLRPEYPVLEDEDIGEGPRFDALHLDGRFSMVACRDREG